ncbi:MAG: AAA family ATPase [Bacteroidales bacterium]|nr:AAA family ATPase [Bacteroidales bacterium]
MKRERPYIIVLTGPESTGKTTLAGQLARHFGGSWIPEYARNYVEHLDRPYVFEDVIRIARYQIKQTDRLMKEDLPAVFLDTDLIILKIWLQVMYENVPGWLQEAIEKRKIDLYLLCRPDIPWKYDPVRENPGGKREELFLIYEKELYQHGFPYRVVEGEGEERFRKAKVFVEEVINKDQ